MAFTDLDRDLLRRCLAKQPGSWNDFVDRFLGLIYHAIHYSAHLRSARVSPEDVEDIAAEVLVQILADDFKVLRLFSPLSARSGARSTVLLGPRSIRSPITSEVHSKPSLER